MWRFERWNSARRLLDNWYRQAGASGRESNIEIQQGRECLTYAGMKRTKWTAQH
jgi:hypothetical protein